MNFESVGQWRKYVIKNWGLLKKGSDSLPLKSAYERLIAIALLPTMPKNVTSLRRLLRNLNTMRYGKAIRDRLKSIYADQNFNRTLENLISVHLDTEFLSQEEREGLDWMLVTTSALAGISLANPESQTFVKTILEDLNQKRHMTSAVRVQAGMISAGQNVVFAGQDVNIVNHYYQGDKTRLKSYLAMVRSEWNIPVSSILPGFTHQNEATLLLHKLYTPVDIWTDGNSDTTIEEQMQRQFREIEQDMSDLRQSAQEIIA
ncbi:MAG: hypothetical protein Q9P44_11940, partial [Anaerolineae bacterium]|nr:hypothetical protein [Anaerolineae bacterium]